MGGAKDGLVFWDAHSGEEIILQVPPRWYLPVSFDGSGALLSMSAAGLERWPVASGDGDGAAKAKLPQSCWGPPQLLAANGNTNLIGHSQDSQVLVIPRFNEGAELLFPEQPKRRLFLPGQQDVRFGAVSPNGQWVATGNYHASPDNVVIWEAVTGKPICVLPIRAGSAVRFSPDGRWLATERDKCRLWQVGNWQEHLTIEGSYLPAFASDGKMMAVKVKNDEGVVRLLDPDSGREFARLTAPDEMASGPVCFSPDGGQLVVVGQDSRSAHIWDLRGLREQLRQFDLDWDLPSYPPPNSNGGPLRLELRP